MITLPLEDRYRVDLAKPVFTLDVNQIAVRPPAQRPPGYECLAAIEHNYFETGLVEVAVTPETSFEITGGVPDSQLGSYAYQRLVKSRWYKQRPSGSTLPLEDQQANELWVDMRQRLWPTVTDDQLTANQRADVSQLFFHAVSSGSTARNSVFITQDQNFLNKADDLQTTYGVQVMTHTVAWDTYAPQYDLVTPTTEAIDAMWRQQQELTARLRSDMT